MCTVDAHFAARECIDIMLLAVSGEAGLPRESDTT